MPVSGLRLAAQLKCIYNNACSMGNKLEDLEATVQQDSYDLVTITETWWETLMTRVLLWMAISSSEGVGKERGGGVALYVRDCFGCIELNNFGDKVKCLWVKLRGKASKADILLGVCYRPPNQDEEADEVFCKRLAEISQLIALVSVGDFDLADICWKHNAAERKQFRRFLECVEDNFLAQLVSEPTMADGLLDLLFTNKERLVGDVVAGDTVLSSW